MNAWSCARRIVSSAALSALLACGDDASNGAPKDAGASSVLDVGLAPPRDAGVDAALPVDDAGDASVSAGDAAAPDPRFATSVVSVTYGGCAGFGQAAMPRVVLGPPVGGGTGQGGLDVVSLGQGGEIVLRVGATGIVNGPGADFIVFENAFNLGGDPTRPFAEPGEVSVSDDGVTWRTFPCTATGYPYGSCAGWHPTLSSPTNGVSPVDPATSGGDAFDLADLGVARARFVRIRDVGSVACSDADAGGAVSTTNGFDLDAVAVVNAGTN